MKKIGFLVLFCSLANYSFSSDSASESHGWNVGAGIGAANISVKSVGQPGFKSTSKSAAVVTAFGGYKYTDWFGLEIDVSQSDSITDESTGLDASVWGISFSPKFSLQFNDHLSSYLKVGAQYLAYDQKVDSLFGDKIKWAGIDPFLGVGLQYQFDFGLLTKIDYRYLNMRLERKSGAVFSSVLFDESIDFGYRTLTLTAGYQF